MNGKTALVMGGSRGVGLQVALALGQAGARILLSARLADDLEQAVADLQAAGINARWCAADCTQQADVDHLVDQTLARMGDVDVLVNCTSTRNLQGYSLLPQTLAARSMVPQHSGCIVHVCSAANADMADAVLSMSQIQRAQWHGQGIAVHVLSAHDLVSDPESDALAVQCLALVRCAI